ncbi:HNH endonuclease [Herbidospora sp. RD11066]
MPRRECLDCETLHSGSGPRCETCRLKRQRVRDAERGTTTERGLGWEHQKARALLLADQPACHWCGAWPATHADHVQQRALGGRSVLENYVPSCASCNEARQPPRST